MNSFKTFAVALLIIAQTSQLSMATPMEDPLKDLRKTVYRLLENPKIDRPVDEDVLISIFLTVEKQLVVLHTDSRTKELDEFIKTRMNYRRIDVEGLKVNHIIHIMVHFKLH